MTAHPAESEAAGTKTGSTNMPLLWKSEALKEFFKTLWVRQQASVSRTRRVKISG